MFVFVVTCVGLIPRVDLEELSFPLYRWIK